MPPSHEQAATQGAVLAHGRRATLEGRRPPFGSRRDRGDRGRDTVVRFTRRGGGCGVTRYNGRKTTFFVVERRRGPEWDPALPLEAQTGWEAHAAFMDGLVDAGVVVLGGPLADERRVVLVMEAASEDDVHTVLGRDPWSGSHLVVDSVDAWTIRLDGRTR